MEEKCTFAEILGSITGETDFIPILKDQPQPLPAPVDALQLSVQAEKALALPKKNICSESPQMEEGKLARDVQGNKIQISANGVLLASDKASSVAWETRCPKLPEIIK